jgi:CelD/BcsL family acetyltransferase involved in cellulose biosynthesis
VHIEVLRPADLTTDQISRWRAAHAADPLLAHPMWSPDFVLAAAELRPATTRVAVIRDEAGRHGWFAFERRGRAGLGQAAGYGLSDAQGMTYEPGLRVPAAELLRACDLPLWRFTALHDRAMCFEEPARGRFVLGRTPNPVVDLSGGWDPYLADLRRRSRSTLPRLRRYERRLAERAPLRFVFAEDDPAMLETMFRLKSEQYRRKGYPDRLADRGTTDLVRHLTHRRSPTCAGALSVLYTGDEPAAFWWSVRSDTVLVARVTVYAPEHSRWSPGLVLLLKVLEHVAGLGIRLVDLGTGDQAYKQTLMTRMARPAEGEIVRAHPAAYAHLAVASGSRALRDFITERPALRAQVQDGLRRFGQWRTRPEAT